MQRLQDKHYDDYQFLVWNGIVENNVPIKDPSSRSFQTFNKICTKHITHLSEFKHHNYSFFPFHYDPNNFNAEPIIYFHVLLAVAIM